MFRLIESALFDIDHGKSGFDAEDVMMIVIHIAVEAVERFQKEGFRLIDTAHS